MQCNILGFPVCNTALLTLTGLNARMLQQPKGGPIHGQISTLPAHEMGTRAYIKSTHYTTTSYVSARQWLEQYAATHAEQNPMDDKAYLAPMINEFYHYQCRHDMKARGEQQRNTTKEANHGAHERPTGVQISTPPHVCNRLRMVNHNQH